MNKTELLKKCWISHTKRLPPDTEETIIVWNYELERPWPIISFIARRDAKRWVRDPKYCEGQKNAALLHSHWIKLPDPHNF